MCCRECLCVCAYVLLYRVLKVKVNKYIAICHKRLWFKKIFALKQANRKNSFVHIINCVRFLHALFSQKYWHTGNLLLWLVYWSFWVMTSNFMVNRLFSFLFADNILYTYSIFCSWSRYDHLFLPQMGRRLSCKMRNSCSDPYTPFINYKSIW